MFGKIKFSRYGILMSIAILLLFSLNVNGQNSDELDRLKMDAALNIISNQYVDNLDKDKLVEDAINGILQKLDPHSVYLSPKKVKSENEKLASSFEGIGIQFNILNDTIMVISPISGGPSEKLGIQSGDKIVEIDGEVVAGNGITNSGVRERLLGDKGTKVVVGIKRRGEKELLDFEITRDKIPFFSVDASYMVDENIGYIKINRFAASTAQEFRESMKDLKSKGMKNMILDLTGNGGGYLYTAFELADEFLEKGNMIVYTEGDNSPKRELKASARGDFETGNLIVLINGGSASASEIVTGAIQDWDRGLVIGRRSFGKGLVQKPYKLPDESEIRLTIARYYTPTGRLIQKSYKEGREAYHEERLKRFERGELTSMDSIHFPDSLKYFTPNKRIVYGGGGIMPDIFIPLDTTQNSKYASTVNRKGLSNLYALQYVDQHREELNRKYPDALSFKKNFDVEEALQGFYDFAEENGVEKNENQINKSNTFLHYMLKGLIARNLYDIDAYYLIFNDYRDDFKKAVEVMKDKETFKLMRVNNYN
jgi:carboxyl-terminal processing protease